MRPWERVLFCPVRDANCFFHLMESMWMLAGRSDARWLDTYVHDFSARYAEPSGYMHGAYGYRWRHNFLVRSPSRMEEAGPTRKEMQTGRDQLVAVAELLREDPTTRQAVVAMWDPFRDLNANVRDKPCNTQLYFRAKRNPYTEQCWLDMTICCRSNDIVWGAYGANAVHMSVVHEYVAAMSGMLQGRMYQVSNNWHGYEDVLDRVRSRGSLQGYDPYAQMDVSHHRLFDPETVGSVYGELQEWCEQPGVVSPQWRNTELFSGLLVPMVTVHRAYQGGDWQMARLLCQRIGHTDWRLAAEQWLQRREDARVRREARSQASGAGSTMARLADDPPGDDGGALVGGGQDTAGDLPRG